MNTGIPARLCPHSVFDYPCPTSAAPYCNECQIWIESLAKLELCPECGMNLSGEREVFGSDTVHSCRSGIVALRRGK